MAPPTFKPTSRTTVVGMAELARLAGLTSDKMVKIKKEGGLKLRPVGTVSGKDAYDLGEARAWAAKHMGATAGAGATRTASRATRTATTAATAKAETAAPAKRKAMAAKRKPAAARRKTAR